MKIGFADSSSPRMDSSCSRIESKLLPTFTMTLIDPAFVNWYCFGAVVVVMLRPIGCCDGPLIATVTGSPSAVTMRAIRPGRLP